ncbi:unnamed protein product [Ceutorhynchus assimilis]|uniref:Uncharacterized protein n=1 Tax=Ceutorhynchus assimilis TaxID=467358 RepID=A0A9N9QGW4_9CUCU|nr:unnamed protein product [Ceutorhynchus assimilis]
MVADAKNDAAGPAIEYRRKANLTTNNKRQNVNRRNNDNENTRIGNQNKENENRDQITLAQVSKAVDLAIKPIENDKPKHNGGLRKSNSAEITPTPIRQSEENWKLVSYKTKRKNIMLQHNRPDPVRVTNEKQNDLQVADIFVWVFNFDGRK